MKVILAIITVFALVIGASINSLALTVLEQIYAAMFYIMALMAFCTFALLFKGPINWKCRWLKRECGLDEEDEAARLRNQDEDNMIETLIVETDDDAVYDGERAGRNSGASRKRNQ